MSVSFGPPILANTLFWCSLIAFKCYFNFDYLLFSVSSAFVKVDNTNIRTNLHRTDLEISRPTGLSETICGSMPLIIICDIFSYLSEILWAVLLDWAEAGSTPI